MKILYIVTIIRESQLATVCFVSSRSSPGTGTGYRLNSDMGMGMARKLIRYERITCRTNVAFFPKGNRYNLLSFSFAVRLFLFFGVVFLFLLPFCGESLDKLCRHGNVGGTAQGQSGRHALAWPKELWSDVCISINTDGGKILHFLVVKK